MDAPLIEQPGSAGTAPTAEESQQKRSLLGFSLKLIGLVVVAGLLLLLGWATLSAGKGKNLVGKIAVGDKPAAPSFALPVIWPRASSWPPPLRGTLADGTLKLRDLRGWPVVVNFWASWCVPCRKEAPILAASSRLHYGQVVFLGIDLQDLRGDALSFLREFDTPYVSVYDRGDKATRAYGTTGVPETYYIDARGRIVAHSPGVVSKRTLEQGIASITRRTG